MYENFAEAVNGFSKNVIHFFGNSYLLAFSSGSLLLSAGWRFGGFSDCGSCYIFTYSHPD
jgi:hypothetical protein